MATDFTSGSVPESLPGNTVRLQPKHLGSNIALGSCPSCSRATSWSHCACKGCRWLFCISCRLVWSERTGRWFRYPPELMQGGG